MRYCWWREGGRCYNDKWYAFSRDTSGRSNRICTEECSHRCRTNPLDFYFKAGPLTVAEQIEWERIQKNP